jgi:hypothetical protein
MFGWIRNKKPQALEMLPKPNVLRAVDASGAEVRLRKTSPWRFDDGQCRRGTEYKTTGRGGHE